ncbi:uncharacterized protein LOC122380656 isoform X3 [Amphibalanus amphitrite]|uniref:uncharacterized protein LOC122380656 isoform X3 n=1 Tax=Amphibalanus amphitrite TaxID=1232801 RepID=UPI001C9123AB|nr:uncharacterized protein LOC122380656 isoform X3 [Amphibalanus amphitrite]
MDKNCQNKSSIRKQLNTEDDLRSCVQIDHEEPASSSDSTAEDSVHTDGANKLAMAADFGGADASRPAGAGREGADVSSAGGDSCAGGDPEGARSEPSGHVSGPAARQDTGQPSARCSDCAEEPAAGSERRAAPSDSATGSQRGGADSSSQPADRLTAQARLQEAIDKVEQLDRSLEKKLKENLEAKAVTADLRALVRRELAELDGRRAGRQASREEADNTLQFLRVLVDNDSESETSGRVTPIFQTQVRFGRAEVPAAPAADGPGPAAPADRADRSPDEPGGPLDGPPPPLGHPASHQYFIRRNIELAQEAGGALAMTDEDRRRVEQLLDQDDDRLENAFSVDEQHRRLLSSLDDRLSSLGASVAGPAGSTSLVSQPAGVGPPTDGGGDSEPDYLQASRHDREASAHLETLHRRLQRLAEPAEVRPLDRSAVDAMVQETIASLAAAPGGLGDPGAGSLVSVPCRGSDGGGAPSEAPTEATLDVRSVLSGTRLDENERQLAAELRPDSPTAWLVAVSQGDQRLVVPRLSRALIASLLSGDHESGADVTAGGHCHHETGADATAGGHCHHETGADVTAGGHCTAGSPTLVHD